MPDDVVPAWLRTALAEEPEQCDLHVEGVRVRSYLWGKPGGTPVVLVHGGLSHAHWWDHIAPLLPGRQRGDRSVRARRERKPGELQRLAVGARDRRGGRRREPEPARRVRTEHGLVTEDMAAEMRGLVPPPVVDVEIPAAGHNPMLEQPLALVGVLRTLLTAWFPAVLTEGAPHVTP